VFVCLVADTEAGNVAMRQYLRKVGPFTMHPDRVGYRDPVDRLTEYQRFTQWIDGERVGVLLKSGTGEWRLSWFDPSRLRRSGDTWLFGRGEWSVSLDDADEVERPSREELEAIGIDRALDHND